MLGDQLGAALNSHNFRNSSPEVVLTTALRSVRHNKISLPLALSIKVHAQAR